MTIELTPDVERMVREGLRRGPYATADELIGDAVQMLLEQQSWFADHRAEFATHIEKGWASAERGELIDSDQVPRRMEERKRAFLNAPGELRPGAVE